MDSKQSKSHVLLNVPRFEQPDDLTCGPTCLTQVFRYYGLDVTLHDVIHDTPRNPDGGTLAVNLGITAIQHGFNPLTVPFGLRVFDPSWRDFGPAELISKLRQRHEAVESRRQQRAIAAHIEYLKRGGQVRFAEPERELLLGFLRKGQPILTGLNATFLYQTPRELDNEYDDIHGHAAGHFVVICGYYPKSDRFVIRDPARMIPFSRSGKYSVPSERLLASILLGDVTYDAVLLILGNRKRKT